MTDIALLERPAGAPASRRPRVPEALRPVALREERRLLAHPFLQRCASGTVTLAELRRYLVQQGHYSRYFTRYLCALISQLPDGEHVLRLAGNLAEELGFGDARELPHSRLYAQMLQHFDLALEHEPATAQTQALVDTMFMLCRQPGGVAGLGALCLGAEAVVPALYARILEGFAAHGVPASRLSFFHIHVACDDEHAQTMFDILAEGCAQPGVVETVAAAATTAVSARLRMFDALLDHPLPLGA